MTDELWQKVAAIIEKSRFFARYGEKNHWTSGSSTTVYPITLWYPSSEIDIQLNGDDNRGIQQSAKSLIKELSKLMEVTDHFHCKYDGSCPDEYRIYFK